ncbi:ABC transporter permease [Desulfovibrio inopinatus]|uniref:ABC transporter permease n=1 Tax=Desulfovibrio inopinatus TaxID=102109 RepID=UPI000416C15F|nr:ABC transporter permease [Desulfovibrio inopinatus]
MNGITNSACGLPDCLPKTPLDYLRSREALLFFLLVFVIIANSLISPYFLDIYNLADSTQNFSEKGVIVLSMALVIIGREIDISVASIIALCGVLMGMAASAGLDTWAIVLVGLVTGSVAGAINGLLVTRLDLPSIIVTIGTMSLYRGIAFIILGDQAYTDFPNSFQSIGQTYFFNDLIPSQFLVFIVLAAVTWYLLHYTVYGRRLYAIGNNPIGARYSGVRVNNYRLWILTANGFTSALAAILLVSRIATARPNMAPSWELEIITIAILGGVNIFGGSGKIPGVILAVLLIGMVQFGMQLNNIPGVIMSIFTGVLLIVSLVLPIALGKVFKETR